MGTRAIFLITPFLFSISASYDAFIRYQSARSARIAKGACILAGLLVMYEERDGGLSLLKVDPGMDGLRGEPRFKAILERIGLS